MTHRLLLWATLPAMVLTQAVLVHAQIVCGAPQAKLVNNVIQIAPNGTDDTDTIQCALDLAVEKNIPKVRLTRGEFFVSTLSAEDFMGTLQGGGKEFTRLTLLGGLDCSAVSGAIKFAGGEPRLRWLTVGMPRYGSPCSGGSLNAMVQFTGVTNVSVPCSYDVVFATIDRVALEGPRNYVLPPWDIINGILVSPEESDEPTCPNNLYGTFKLDRSVVSGFPLGAKIHMLGGGAQIGVYNSTFDGNHTGLYIDDSNATVTVSKSHFASKPANSPQTCTSDGTGMVVSAHSEDITGGMTRLDVHGNTFDVRAGWPCSAIGLVLRQESRQTILNPVISNNHFRLTRELWDSLLSSWGVSGGVLNGNRINISGQPDLAATVRIDNGADWTVVLNEGFEHLPDQIDIGLGRNTSNILIGPDQGATVQDEGINNIVLPQ